MDIDLQNLKATIPWADVLVRRLLLHKEVVASCRGFQLPYLKSILGIGMQPGSLYRWDMFLVNIVVCRFF